MTEPTSEIIKSLKDKHPDRALFQVELKDDSESLFFLMTGANKIEYQKFTDEIIDSKSGKDEKERGEKALRAIESAALAQIRWPERDEVRTLFAKYPAIIPDLAEEIHKGAGASFEVRSKKL